MGADTQLNEGPATEPSLLPPTTRRGLLGQALGAGALVAAAGAFVAGCGSDSGTLPYNPGPGVTPTPTPSSTPGNNPADPSDADILNFALNLEYLEAEYYLRALNGSGLGASDIGAGAGGGAAGSVTGGRAVNFTTPSIRALAEEIAADERAHVLFLRSQLGGAAVPRPAIDFTTAFNAAAQAAGIGQTFDPFANETNFLIGAFVFEDVGVTAYRGGARFLDSPIVVEAAAGILAVEAAHAGAVRSLLRDIGGPAFTAANQIATLRFNAGGGKDEGLSSGTLTGSNGGNTVPSDPQARAYGRTVAEVLRIVYLNAGTTGGGFFPNGANGNIRFAA